MNIDIYPCIKNTSLHSIVQNKIILLFNDIAVKLTDKLQKTNSVTGCTTFYTI